MAEVEGMHLRSSGRENNNKCLVAGGRRKRGEAKMAARILVWGLGGQHLLLDREYSQRTELRRTILFGSVK